MSPFIILRSKKKNYYIPTVYIYKKSELTKGESTFRHHSCLKGVKYI